MENETLILKQDTERNVSNKGVVENSFRKEDQKMNSVEEFGEQENTSGINDSLFSETQEKLAAKDGNENIVTPPADSSFSRKSDSKNNGINDGVQSPKTENTANLAPNTEDLQRGRVEVIRLQAVSNNPQQSLDNLRDGAPEKPAPEVFINENMDIITNVPSVSSQGEYSLATNTQLKTVPMYVTPNVQNDCQYIGPNVGSDILQTAVSSITENIGTAYQQIMLDVNPPEYTILKTKKTSDVPAARGLPWATTSTSSSTSDYSTSSVLYQTSSSGSSDVLNDYHSMDNLSGITASPEIEQFVTADNQVLYGYKDSNGDIHFFGPPNDRESHNEKERKRRGRVSVACNSLRKMIPGISEKTDKATVFEQTAKYLKFLRDKFGTQFDQAYCEKYFQRRS